MPRLTIALLGPPRIEQDGQALVVDTRKAIALLAYLALGEPAGAGRGSLAALFWPDVDQARAHAALRRTLSVLNKALTHDWLRIDRELIALPSSPEVWVDVVEFQARLDSTRAHGHPAQAVCERCLPVLAEAVALYRGDFMAGFTLRDSPGFDDWQFFQGEALRRALAGALERLVAGHTRRGEFEAASGFARRWLALDPLHEPAHRRLMELYAWSGQRSAALRQYQDCVRVLDAELSVAPLEETTHLYEAIRDNRLAPPAGPAAAALAPPIAAASPQPDNERELPLVGRDDELNVLSQAYRAVGPDGRLVVVEGEAGIGKTRLAEAALQPLRPAGALTLVARCYEGELNLAYGPFVEALRGGLVQVPETQTRVRTLAPHWLSEAARLLPELQALRPDLPPPPASDSPGAQSRFFEAVRQVLLAVLSPSGQPPGVLLIDDAHWIDEASLDLLTYLVRRLRGQPVCILVTWRGEQVPPGHRLRHLLAEAQRAGLGVSVRLGRLSLSAVAELASARLPAAEQVAQRLYQETEGLPYFVVEYLASLAGGAHPAGAETLWVLPGGVRSLLEARLATVDETAQQLLHTAAVIGRSFELDTLQAASGRSDDETVQGLEALMAAGLVHEVPALGGLSPAPHPGEQPAPAYDFHHEKLRSLVYEQTSQARRRLLHRRVAEALSAHARRWPRGRAGSIAGQVAQHYQLAGHDRAAAEYFQLAGDHARALYANGDALAHYQAALTLGHPNPAAVHEAIGDLQTLQGDYTAALTSYQSAAEAAPASQARLDHKLGNVYQRQGEWPQAEAHFAAALEGLGQGDGAASRARLLSDWSLAAHRQGQTERAQQLAEAGLALAEHAGDPHALAQAHNILGILATSRGQSEAARRHLERSLALAEAQGDPGARAAALNNLALAHSSHGEHEAALRLTEQALALTTALGDRHREAALHSHLADLLHATGQAEAAMQHLKQSVMIYAEIGAQEAEMRPEIWKLSEW